MRQWRIAMVLIGVALGPLTAEAAPEGRVVIAQGVDPTTLDMMHQQEQPASNVGAQIFESLVRKMEAGGGRSQVFGEITDDDIDNLFKD